MDQTPEQQAVNCLRLGELDRANYLAEQEIIADQGGARRLWLCRFVRADVLRIRGGPEPALAYLDSLPVPEAEDAASCSSFKLRRGHCMGLLGRHQPCQRLLDEAQTIAFKANASESLAEVHLSRAFIHYLRQDYAAADSEYHAVLKLSEQIPGWYFRGYGMWGIGKVLMIREAHKEAIPQLNESLRVFEDVGAKLPIAMVWSELAVCYLGLGDDVQALELLQKAERVDYEAGAIHNYQVSLANIGNVYLYRRDYFTAICYYRRALEYSRQLKDPVSIKKWTFNITLAYARIREAIDTRSMSAWPAC